MRSFAANPLTARPIAAYPLGRASGGGGASPTSPSVGPADPLSFSLSQSAPFAGAADVRLVASTLFACGTGGLVGAFDVGADGKTLTARGAINVGGSPRKLVVVGQHAYISDYPNNTIKSVDFSDLDNPVLADTLSVSIGPDYMCAVGAVIFVGLDFTRGVAAVDISNPADMAEIARVTNATTLRSPTTLHSVGDYILTPTSIHDSIASILTANPASMSVVDSVKVEPELTDPRHAVLDEGNAVLYTCSSTTNRITSVDVSDPTDPTVIASLVLAPSVIPTAMVYNAPYVYIVDNTAGNVRIVDATDPSAMVAEPSVATGIQQGVAELGPACIFIPRPVLGAIEVYA